MRGRDEKSLTIPAASPDPGMLITAGAMGVPMPYIQYVSGTQSLGRQLTLGIENSRKGLGSAGILKMHVF